MLNIVVTGFLVSTMFVVSMHVMQQAASGASNFGADYRHLTSSSPGATADTTTTVTISSGTTGTFMIDPFTSGSTVTGTPSSSSLVGYGWRTAGLVGSSIPAGTWSFTISTKASLIGGTAVAKVYAYSTDIFGGNLASIGSATGSVNIFGSILDQQQTLSFVTGSSTDLTNKVLVVEFWIDVTSGPILSTTVTFNAASSSQTVDLPSPSGTFYLAKASLFSIGESETLTISDTDSRAASLTRSLSASAIPTDGTPSRGILAYRAASETTDLMLTDGLEEMTSFSRMVSDDAVLTDSSSRLTIFARDIAETSDFAVSDMVSRFTTFARQISESASQITDLLTAMVDTESPPSDGGNGSGSGRHGGGSRRDITNLEQLDRIVVNVSLVDGGGKTVSNVLLNHPIKVVIDLKNQQLLDQDCIVIIEMINGENVATDIFVSGESLATQESVRITQDWRPSSAANYEIKVFVWDSLDDMPNPLTNIELKTLSVD